jgi:hypothetical protein
MESPMAAKIALRGGNQMARQGSKVGSQKWEYQADCPRKSMPTAHRKHLSKIKDEPTILLKIKHPKSDKVPHPTMFMILNGLSII